MDTGQASRPASQPARAPARATLASAVHHGHAPTLVPVLAEAASQAARDDERQGSQAHAAVPYAGGLWPSPAAGASCEQQQQQQSSNSSLRRWSPPERPPVPFHFQPWRGVSTWRGPRRDSSDWPVAFFLNLFLAQSSHTR